MSKTRLSQCEYVEYGYAQVEPNHLSAQRTGQIYAQLPMGVDVLENGQFAKYDYRNGVVDLDSDGEWMLVYNAVKIYEDKETEADYVMKKEEATSGPVIGVTQNNVPRLFKTNVGDIFTTNAIDAADVDLGATLYVGTNGYLGTTSNGTMKWQVVKKYTLADGQKAVKVMRIA